MTKSHAFELMRKFVVTTRQIPKSYIVGTSSGFKVEKTIIARGGSADIRKGRYRGMDVAVKTIRISLESNVEAIHKVRRALGCPILDD